MVKAIAIACQRDRDRLSGITRSFPNNSLLARRCIGREAIDLSYSALKQGRVQVVN